jgi:hypothetical protein
MQVFFGILTLRIISAPPIEPIDPCQPSPCGPNSICVKTDSTPACSCQPGYIGVPPTCRPECTISAECPAAFACVAQRCKDPCEHACGSNAICSVVDHRATCACEPGLEGDPFQGCSFPKGKKCTNYKRDINVSSTFYVYFFRIVNYSINIKKVIVMYYLNTVLSVHKLDLENAYNTSLAKRDTDTSCFKKCFT